MPSNIISSFDNFSKKFEVFEKDERTEAIKTYFKRGGVISAVKSNNKWPRLTYPSPMRVQSQVKELEDLKSRYLEKQKEWKKKLNDAQTYHSRHQMLKLKEPLYWKHVTKKMVDPDYRDDSIAVQLPVHLVADPKWKPMVKMFVEDLEYRKNLTETVHDSIVYKDDKKVAKYADQLQDFRSEISTAKLKTLEKQISKIQTEINALKIIEKWAGE